MLKGISDTCEPSRGLYREGGGERGGVDSESVVRAYHQGALQMTDGWMLHKRG